MTDPVVLRGVTWGHARGLVPLVAACAAYSDQHDDAVRVEWDVRSLWAFGEAGLDDVARSYDLLIVDHPLMGDAAALLVPFAVDDPPVVDLLGDAVGRSQHSYVRGDVVPALALDAACQVAVWRPDRLAAAGVDVPAAVDDVLALPAEVAVGMPNAPVDLVTTWFALCASLGEEPMRGDSLVSADVGSAAAEALLALLARAGQGPRRVNPIALLRAVSRGDGPDYVPFAYGYSNYARPGFARHVLASGPAPAVAGGGRCGTLGGAGVAVSAHSRAANRAQDVARWLTSRECQSGPYLEAGGQPARGSAWRTDAAGVLAPTFFPTAISAFDDAYVRPNGPGMTAFQRVAGERLADLVDAGARATDVARELAALWRAHPVQR